MLVAVVDLYIHFFHSLYNLISGSHSLERTGLGSGVKDTTIHRRGEGRDGLMVANREPNGQNRK